ncbi:hypothetical protein BC936DRAFT_140301 [Jimgerdemannia flammicorona]|uniref:Uncharacterized protein n=1 Tax=Jimgerdemannia flammicorona TaxID=994334 RepID=A0A433AVJ1_9FUNG|nr:hypothetical protein BC936DRAFT_140301 [Jimgerdemannia flammicorona]
MIVSVCGQRSLDNLNYTVAVNHNYLTRVPPTSLPLPYAPIIPEHDIALPIPAIELCHELAEPLPRPREAFTHSVGVGVPLALAVTPGYGQAAAGKQVVEPERVQNRADHVVGGGVLVKEYVHHAPVVVEEIGSEGKMLKPHTPQTYPHNIHNSLHLPTPRKRLLSRHPELNRDIDPAPLPKWLDPLSERDFSVAELVHDDDLSRVDVDTTEEGELCLVKDLELGDLQQLVCGPDVERADPTPESMPRRCAVDICASSLATMSPTLPLSYLEPVPNNIVERTIRLDNPHLTWQTPLSYRKIPRKGHMTRDPNALVHKLEHVAYGSERQEETVRGDGRAELEEGAHGRENFGDLIKG